MPKNALLFLVGLTVLLHLYIGQRLLPSLPAVWMVAGIGWLLLSSVMSPAPFLSRAIRNKSLSDPLNWVAYLLMGVFSSLFVLTLLRDVFLLTATLLNMLAPGSIPMSDAVQTSAVLVLALTGLVTLVGVFNARRVAKVIEIDLPIAELPDALSGFTIAQISDIHVGPTIKHGYLNAIVQAVNALKPDMVAITGDLIDGSVARLKPHVAPLARLSAKHGVFFVTGNHEYYSGVESWVVELRRLGVTVLLNQNVVLDHGDARILVGGVTDFTAHHYDPASKSDPFAAMAGAPADVSVKLLLAHQPRTAAKAAEAGFHVQLSGHTHGGQIWPWNFFVRFQQPFTSGLNRVKNLLVYTSRGTGYWGPPIRFGAPSEITHLRLVAA
jgi:predicted MPP superfamily phosphohydrolase